MIKIKKEKETKTPTKKSKPYYMLEINYMIGDAKGYTSEKGKISADNPYLEPFLKIIKKIKPTQGHWGIVFDGSLSSRLLKEKQITKEEHKLFSIIVSPYDNEYEDEEMDDKEVDHLDEIGDLIRSETEYSFLVYQGFELTYVDEFKKKHETTITK
jgi:hypothetical protein